MVLPPLTTDDELNEELLEEMKRAQVLEGDTERIDIQVTPMKTVKLMLLFLKKKFPFRQLRNWQRVASLHEDILFWLEWIRSNERPASVIWIA